MPMRPMMAVAGIGLLLAAVPARGDEECDAVIESLDDAVQIASKVADLEMAEITKTKPQTDAEKATVKSRYCRVSGEFLGASRAYRAVAAECLQGAKRRATLNSLDTSIKQVADSIAKACN